MCAISNVCLTASERTAGYGASCDYFFGLTITEVYELKYELKKLLAGYSAVLVKFQDIARYFTIFPFNQISP